MQLGMIGLGRMGGNMVRRLMRNGHDCVVFDLDPSNVSALAKEGASGAGTLDAFVQALTPPRAAWVMVPAGQPTEQTVEALASRMQPGDIIIDGGNSYYKDDVRRATALKAKGLHYVDVGTSGGVWGLERGYCLMVGASQEAAHQYSHRVRVPTRRRWYRRPRSAAPSPSTQSPAAHRLCSRSCRRR